MEPLLPDDPKTLGDFSVIGRLGEGGMGTVYLGSKGTRNVALKVIHPSLLRDASSRTRFEREIKVLERIDSPYVGKILDHGIEEGQGWFATEFINGPDLKSLIEEQGPLDPDRWAQVAHELLTGLKAVHEAGVIHRDIKPSNIVLSDAGLKIIDFGIAQLNDMTSVTVSGLISGSPAWFSPEQIEGKLLSPATDLFSAGSVLVYAATGQSPWGAADSMTKAMVFGILVSEPDLSGLTESQRKIVEPLLVKDAGLRASNSLNQSRQPATARPPKAQRSPEELELPISGRKEAPRQKKIEGAFSEHNRSVNRPLLALAILMIPVALLFGAFVVLPNFTNTVAEEEPSAEQNVNLDIAPSVDFGPEIYSGNGVTIYSAGGEDWGLGPSEVFNRWYQVRATGDGRTQVIRLDCPIGSLDELGEPIESIEVQVRNSDQDDWATHTEAVL
jgi:serine/threonine protein kinase